MHRARKRFGQHFLHDRSIINRIIDSVAPQPAERIVEIGPGLGAITLPLLDRIGTLDAVEIDRDAVRHLRETTPSHGTLRLHEADVLEFEFSELASGDERLRLVGNLPYNISTPLLFRLIQQCALFIDMHFMLQKEVVDRMAAGANDDAYGRLSVMLAPWLKVEPLFDIGPSSFRPPPRVISTFVRLTPHSSSPFAITDQRKFATVVAAAFSQRRKTLRNALRPLLSAEQIEAAGIDPGARAETIEPAGFAALALQLLCTSSQVHDDNRDG
ncbi:MAG TPA: 16S rRNA (adenine(1518)-N(6)/adenine(1519)-N(6))-dimethyltransferase RsmA [Steroidobacteraceae bacterium]|nr:16S rRNA (adenine(1518)-N(6)/adenine(1519)-N(6))-dimethyltransferase RsmA [Steroidobacteraceae bacterium]